MAKKNVASSIKDVGGRRRTGYDRPKTVNYKEEEYNALVDWGANQNPVMNFSDVVHFMTVDFMKSRGITPANRGKS